MIAIIDYDAGNILSVRNAFSYLGVNTVVTSDKEMIDQAEGLVLPGVGAFPDAMRNLDDTGLTEFVKRQAARKPFLGICLGMQLLFEQSEESGLCCGLGLIPGQVTKLSDSDGAARYKIPHMGWNDLSVRQPSRLLHGLADGDYVYFVHSYKAQTDEHYIVASTQYSENVPAVVWDGRFVYGTQFHPEKSSETGLKILKNFAALCNI